MATARWAAPESIQTPHSTDLNSLANSSSESTGKVLGSAIDNEADKYMNADFELNLGSFGGTPSSGGYVELYLLYSVDGTNFCDGSTTVDPPATALVGAFAIRANTAAQRITIDGVPLLPFKFKTLLRNKTGQSFNASGNTLKMRRYNPESV
jgi:hypothetical protein